MTVTPDGYKQFQHLLAERDSDGVLLLTINRPDALNAANERLHWELGEVWRVIDRDPFTKVAVVTGAGKAFSAGGDFAMIEKATVDVDEVRRQHRHAAAIVENMTGTDKPIIAAINGVAVGAGLAVALLSDISIIAESAKISDGHVRLGIAAGDHAVMVWPLLCGLAKTKYYLLTAEFMSGQEAERIGLVSRCVPDDQVLPLALEIAGRLADSGQVALQWTKRSLNQWLRLAAPIFQHSLALEMLSLLAPDAKEGVTALYTKRPATFPSASGPFDDERY